METILAFISFAGFFALVLSWVAMPGDAAGTTVHAAAAHTA